MYANLTKFLQGIRSSYWFIPACMVLVAIVLSMVMTWLDTYAETGWIQQFQWLNAVQTDGARSVLNVIAGSTIGVAGVTFSITIVAVSFASANFGPRLIANFMRDRGNQATLGIFIGTYVYCLLVLRTVRNASAEDIENNFQAFVPHFSVLTALLLALISVGVLIYFIHHIPESLNVGNMAAQVGRRLCHGIDGLFPDRDPHRDESGITQPDWDAREKRSHHTQIRSARSGYIQALDVARLVELGEAYSALLRVQYRPGDFVAPDGVIIDIWSDQEIDARKKKALSACFAVGNQRTAHQNVLFLADQLVEIIGRAMSPGVNDPFTAMTCLSWLKVGLLHFIDKDLASVKPDPSERVRIYSVTFERFSSVIFSQTLPYICGDRNVVLHAITILIELISYTENADHRAVLREHLEKLAAASEAKIHKDAGGADIEQRVKQAMTMIETENGYERHRQSQNWFGGRS